MVDKKKVCKECGALTKEKVCEICKSNNLADKYKGTVVILSEDSEVAKKLNIEKKGMYALKY